MLMSASPPRRVFRSEGGKLLAGRTVTKNNDPEPEITDLRPCVRRKCEETVQRLHFKKGV